MFCRKFPLKLKTVVSQVTDFIQFPVSNRKRTNPQCTMCCYTPHYTWRSKFQKLVSVHNNNNHSASRRKSQELERPADLDNISPVTLLITVADSLETFPTGRVCVRERERSLLIRITTSSCCGNSSLLHYLGNQASFLRMYTPF